MRCRKLDILRDLIVGVRDDSARRKLLHRRNHGLADAIDICKASEVASKLAAEVHDET